MEFWKRKLVCLQLQGKTCFCLLNYVFWGNDKMIQVDVVPFGRPDSRMEFVMVCRWHFFTHIHIHICIYISIYIYVIWTICRYIYHICKIYTHIHEHNLGQSEVWSIHFRIHGWFYDFCLLLPGPRAMVWYLRFWCFWKQILLEITG